MQASPKEQFDQLFGQLKELYTLFFDSFSKLSASYMLIIGWLITSESARSFLKMHREVAYLFIAILAVLSAVYTILCKRMFRKSAHLVLQMNELNYMDAPLYKGKTISAASFYLILLSNYFILLAICCVLICL